MYIIYDFIFALYALVYLPYLLLTNRLYAGFGMRFGFFSAALKQQLVTKSNIWLHAVSVGEVMALEGFVDLLRQKYPSHQFVVTVTTKAGFRLARERLKDKALVLATPLDFSWVVRRFLALINPKVYIVVETEIWPNLFARLSRQHIPFVVINGRISDNSYGRYKAIRFLLKRILNQVSVWCMQSQTHAERIIHLGAESSRVEVTGNIKFDQMSVAEDKPVQGLMDQLWWVAGSTHPGEEEIVLNVHQKIVKNNPQWRLIIAPRHVERVPQIMELIERMGLKGIKFSVSGFPIKAFGNDIGSIIGSDNKEIIVVDTIGQLRSLYSIASLVFVGKSLGVLGGGHNVIEPAFYAKPIVVGPRTENFKDIIASFKEREAIIQVDDVGSFEAAIEQLSQDASKRKMLGEAAKQVVKNNQGASGRCLEQLHVILSAAKDL